MYADMMLDGGAYFIHGDGSGNYVWSIYVGACFTLFYVEPINLMVYWSRPIADYINGIPISQHTSVAGFYTFFSSYANPYYCEGYESVSGEILTGIYGGGWYTANYLTNPLPLGNCWDDPVLVFDSANYLPASLT